jgi:hypothetical protein
VVGGDVQVGRAGALGRERAVEADAGELRARSDAGSNDHVGGGGVANHRTGELGLLQTATPRGETRRDVARQVGGVLDPDPHRQPVLWPVKGQAVVAGAARRRHDETPLVEVSGTRTGGVAARRGRRQGERGEPQAAPAPAKGRRVVRGANQHAQKMTAARHPVNAPGALARTPGAVATCDGLR